MAGFCNGGCMHTSSPHHGLISHGVDLTDRLWLQSAERSSIGSVAVPSALSAV